MAKSVIIKLTTAGTSTGPFNLLSNYDSYVTPFETNIAKTTLVTGYTSSLVPDTATIVRVLSSGSCTNHTDLTIVPITTSTTTSTTTAIPFDAEIEFTVQDNISGEFEVYMTIISGVLSDSLGSSGTVTGYTDSGCSTSTGTDTWSALQISPPGQTIPPGASFVSLVNNPHNDWNSRKITSLLVESTTISGSVQYVSKGGHTYKITGFGYCNSL